MTRAICTIILICFAGSYLTFKSYSSSEYSQLPQDYTYFNLFTKYKHKPAFGPVNESEHRILDPIMDAYHEEGISAIRTKVLYGTGIAFLLSLYPAYRVYRKYKKG